MSKRTEAVRFTLGAPGASVEDVLIDGRRFVSIDRIMQLAEIVGDELYDVGPGASGWNAGLRRFADEMKSRLTKPRA